MGRVNKFGRNIGINSGVTADIWDDGNTGGQLLWLAPTAARIHQIASTSAADAAAVGTLTLAAGSSDGDTITIGAKVYTLQEILTEADGNVFINPSATATGIFTSTTVLEDGDTATIGNKVYTFQTTLTDVDGNVFIDPDATATGIFTSATVLEDGDTVTIGSKVYTFQVTLTDVDGNVFIDPDVSATETLTLTENAADTNTVTLGTQVYTFQTVLTDAPDNVLIGVAATNSIDNLIAAIMGGAGEGTAYGTGTAVNTLSDAVIGGGDTMDCTALLAGTVGNSIACSDTLAGASNWGAANFSGGTDHASNSLDNFVAAINGDAGAGTKYATSMVTNTDITAAAGLGDIIDCTAILAGTVGNVTSTTTGGAQSWGAGTLTGGTDHASNSLDNFVAAIIGGAGSGTKYAASMTTHTQVTAAAGELDTIDLTAILAGTVGNVTSTTTGAQQAFDNPTLTGGTNDPSGTIDNLVGAIMLSGTAGTDYATAMTANAISVTAFIGAGDTMLLYVATAGAITTTETGDQMSWGSATTLAGASARTVKIWGLQTWSSPETSETINLRGVDDVATANSYVIIHRMKVMTSGATSINAGEITATSDTDAKVTAQILATNGQTQMAIYGVPSGSIFDLEDVVISLNKTGGAATGFVDVRMLVNEKPQTTPTVFLVKDNFGMSMAGTSSFQREFGTPNRIDGPAIIKFQAISGTASMDVSVQFSGEVYNLQ